MLGLNWGATAAERAAPLPCDELLPQAATRADRAIWIAAPADVLFRWLCQLKVAPYSYDLLDNFGQRSPRELTPGVEQLEQGQRFMRMFRLASFTPGEHITLITRRVAVTYAIRSGEGGSRLVVRVLFDAPAPVGRAVVVGDVVMMRKQLLTLKRLAERRGAARSRA